MINRIVKTVVCCVLLTIPITVFGQQQDSIIVKDNFWRRFYKYFQESNKDKSFDKKFDWTVIGGPSYVADKGFSISVLVGGQFRTDRTDSITQPSFVEMFASLSTTGFYAVGIDGNTLWNKARHRLNYNTRFSSQPTFLWPVGYYGGLDGVKTKYHRQEMIFNIDYLYGVFKNTYVGASLSVDNISAGRFANPVDLGGQKSEYTSLGAGISLQYDSRDVITDPHKGVFVEAKQMFYPGFMNSKGFSTTELDFRAYHKIWKGGVLAYNIHTILSQGDIPWVMYPQLGGAYTMRGYYKGRFYDRNMAEVQVELRQKVYRRIGIATWVGAANIFHNPDSFNIKQTLPNYGVGLRWEFKKRMNIRIDYGMGRNSSGVVFNITEAF